MASRKVELVIKGIQALTKDEKQELAVLLAQEFNFSERTEALESLSESFTKANSVHTAPVGFGTCNCCGR